MSPLKALYPKQSHDQEHTGAPRAGCPKGYKDAHTELPLCEWCLQAVSDLAGAPAVNSQTFSSSRGCWCPLSPKGKGEGVRDGQTRGNESSLGKGDCDKLEGRKEILAHSREAEWTGGKGAKLSAAPGPAER